MPLSLFHFATRHLEGVPRHSWELLDPPGCGASRNGRAIGILLPSDARHPERHGTVVLRLATDALADDAPTTAES